MHTDITNINFLGLSFILFMGICLIILPRRQAFIPIILSAFYMTIGQQLDFFGLNFFALRIIILFGWIRLLVRRELGLSKLTTMDKMIILWAAAFIITYTLLLQTHEAFINRLGRTYDALGLYFLFRHLIHNFDDIEYIIKNIAILILPLSLILLFEKFTGNNIFFIFGGVPQTAWIRSEAFRAQGPFRHAIFAGTVGASLMPLFWGLWFKNEDRYKIVSLVGLVAATIITYSSYSSGPATAYIFGIIGILMWPFRQNMRIVRWSIFLCVIILHTIMKAPVWFLLSRLSSIIGGTGWHRAELIDQAINHFGDWWLIGTKYTANWMPYTLHSGEADITNAYIGQAVNGGLLTMILFIAIIVFSFREIGLSIQALDDRLIYRKKVLWLMGVSLFTHAVSFMAVTYFDQTIVFWYLLLAMIATANIATSIKKDEVTI